MATIVPVQALIAQSHHHADAISAFWIYSCMLKGTVRTGIWGMTDLVDMDNGKIITHEEVLPGKLKDLISNSDQQSGSFSPVLLTYRPDQEVDALISKICRSKEPEIFKQDDVDYQLWSLTDGTLISKLQHAFSNIPKVYMADGHHRLAAAYQNVSHNRRLLSSLYISSDQLSISAFHRLIRMNGRINKDTFIQQLKNHFNVTMMATQDPYRPDRRNVIGMCLRKGWYQLELKTTLSGLSDIPDVSVLQNIILAPLLDIKNAGTDGRLENFPDYQWEDMVDLLRKNETFIGFSLFPMTVNEFLNASESGDILPPKSTWIEPKIPENLLLQAECAG